MDEPRQFAEDIRGVLKRSEEEKLRGMIHGINLPPNAFEMIVPMFREPYGMDLTASIIPLNELEDYQMQYVNMAP